MSNTAIVMQPRTQLVCRAAWGATLVSEIPKQEDAAIGCVRATCRSESETINSWMHGVASPRGTRQDELRKSSSEQFARIGGRISIASMSITSPFQTGALMYLVSLRLQPINIPSTLPAPTSSNKYACALADSFGAIVGGSLQLVIQRRIVIVVHWLILEWGGQKQGTAPTYPHSPDGVYCQRSRSVNETARQQRFVDKVHATMAAALDVADQSNLGA